MNNNYEPITGPSAILDILIRLFFLIIVFIIVSPEQENAQIKSTIQQRFYHHELTDVPLLNQYPSLPTGCEAVSATMLLQWKGLKISAEEVANALPKGSIPFEMDGKLVGGNPAYEFVGNPFLSSGFGVYHKPIYDILKSYYPNETEDMTGCTFEDLLTVIDDGQPVLVWATINMAKPKINSMWYDFKGNQVIWKTPEHALVLIGYTGEEVIVHDPLLGKKINYKQSDFIRYWEYMGSQAITIHK